MTRLFIVLPPLQQHLMQQMQMQQKINVGKQNERIINPIPAAASSG